MGVDRCMLIGVAVTMHFVLLAYCWRLVLRVDAPVDKKRVWFWLSLILAELVFPYLLTRSKSSLKEAVANTSSVVFVHKTFSPYITPRTFLYATYSIQAIALFNLLLFLYVSNRIALN